MSALVGVIMGSKSDWSTLSHTAEMLEKLGIPYEVDANEFAAQRVKAFCGDSPALRQLRDCWRPKRIWSNEDYRRLFREIDERIENSAR